MINKADVIEFFDRHASSWDDEMIRNDEVISLILDKAGVGKGTRVLDIACGTGVLMPDYLQREVGSVTGVDISPEMIKIASEKFPEENVSFLCADAEKDDVGSGYDAIVIYNAFPHFPDPDKLIARLSGLLVPGGRLTVAHGMSREKIDAHHSGAAHAVSMGLMPAENLAAIFDRSLKVTEIISDDRMYQVVGVKE